MSFNNLLKDRCTISLYETIVDPVTKQSKTQKTVLHDNIKCFRQDKGSSYQHITKKDGEKYTDLFFTEYFTDADSIKKDYVLTNRGTEYRVVKTDNPGQRNHHLEIKVDISN